MYGQSIFFNCLLFLSFVLDLFLVEVDIYKEESILIDAPCFKLK